jgi:predicted PurR-regulated permease PerM
MQMSRIEFVTRTVIVVAVAVIPVLVWYLFDVVLIAFGAIILAMLVRLGGNPSCAGHPYPNRWPWPISGVLILSVFGGAGYLFGSRIVDEFQDVLQRAASAGAAIQGQLRGSEFGNLLLSHLSGSDLSVTSVLSGFLKISTSFLEAIVIMMTAPIVVVIFAAVNLLYVHDTLGEETALTDKLL